MLCVDRPRLSREEWGNVFSDFMAGGYNFTDYIPDEKTLDTDIECPVCQNTFTFIRRGNSAEIICKTVNCLHNIMKGIQNHTVWWTNQEQAEADIAFEIPYSDELVGGF